MALVDEITQAISTIPPIMLTEDVIDFPADEDEFVAKYEANNVHMSSVFVSEINTLKDQFNTATAQMDGVVNLVNTSANGATNQANIATTKASEANSSANQALTYKNQVMGYVVPSGASYSVDQLNTKYSAMTKAQFNALAEERKANRAGSGFDNLGKGSSTTSVNVNEGIWTDATQSNKFYIGKTTANSGTSITNHAESVANGVLQKFKNINNSTLAIADILLPTSPTIYPYDTVLTTEQINSGVIKHADSSNSGLVIMGKNLSGTTFNQTVTVVNGKKYVIEYKDNGVRKTLEITASSTSYNISLSGINITKVGMYPLDSISRSDLVFLESWHEDISEKNFVYPLGNVQYLGSNTDGLTGIANGAFTGFETYSLFGNWQTPSGLIGKGYVWSSLTEAQRKAFIANPDNNCYLDGDKVIQVRYRVRAVQGIDDIGFANPYNNYLSTQTGLYIKPKGKQVSIVSEFGIANSLGMYGHGIALWVSKLDYASQFGVFSASPSYDSTTGFTLGSYNGQCFALPLALVHRRNQGMWHHIYNPNGTKLASDSLDSYRTSVSFTSISDCFDPAKLLTTSGYIDTVSGRPDGLFYDQVHEGDILDLRNGSKKVEDYNRLISREFNKLFTGTNRGKEGEKFTEIKTQTTTGTVATVEVNDGTKYKSGDVVYIYDLTASTVKGRFVVKSISSNTLTVDTTFAKLANSYLISGGSTSRNKSNTMLICDVIGSPANYPTEWKNIETPFITLHTAEDGTSLLPDGAKDTFKLSRKANATPLLCLRSTDNGATWTSFTPTFSTTTNAITLTDEPATNLVMVYYQTHTSMTVPVVNSEVLEIGDVFASRYYYGALGCHLGSTLIGKVNTGVDEVPRSDTKSLSRYVFKETGINAFSPSSSYMSTHDPVTLFNSQSSTAYKVLPYLTRLNGKAYLNLVFKEMKHNGTSWGDSNKFEIVDNVSTTTDTNAATVLIGQKTVELPYFIGADE